MALIKKKKTIYWTHFIFNKEKIIIIINHYIYIHDNIKDKVISTMEDYNMKKIKKLLNNPFVKYPLIIISAIAIIKVGYDLGSFLMKLKYN